MSRGTYGVPDPTDPRPRRSGWFTVAVVAALGVGVYFALPAVSSHKREERELDRIAKEKGFASVREYEDAVLRIGHALEAQGAEVRFGPHLSHLDAKL